MVTFSVSRSSPPDPPVLTDVMIRSSAVMTRLPRRGAGGMTISVGSGAFSGSEAVNYRQPWATARYDRGQVS